MRFLLRWWWVLVLALFAPVSLPAGGGTDRNKVQILRKDVSGSFFAGNSCFLRPSPFIGVSSIRKINIGTPVKVLHSWKSADGRNWLHIELSSSEMLNFSTAVRRGWIAI